MWKFDKQIPFMEKMEKEKKLSMIVVFLNLT